MDSLLNIFMKKMILCFPRSKSNLLQEVIAKKYNLTNLADPYVFLHDENLSFQIANETITKISQKMCYQSNIVVKLHMYNILFSNGNKRFFPIESFMLNQYDEIFFTLRDNLADLIASILVAHHKNKWYYVERPDDNFTLTFNMKKHHTTFSMVQNMIINHKLAKLYLQKINKNFTELFYEDIENFDSYTIEQHPTMFDYKKIIANYDELLDFVKIIFGTNNYKTLI